MAGKENDTSPIIHQDLDGYDNSDLSYKKGDLVFINGSKKPVKIQEIGSDEDQNEYVILEGFDEMSKSDFEEEVFVAKYNPALAMQSAQARSNETKRLKKVSTLKSTINKKYPDFIEQIDKMEDSNLEAFYESLSDKQVKEYIDLTRPQIQESIKNKQI